MNLKLVGLTGIALAASAFAAEPDFVTIFDGSSPKGWITNGGKPLPAANVQPEGLNPHKSGGYLVVHEQPHGDFVLSFDYKLSKGCNSGVFLRVSDLKDPVMTGLEIALDDTKGTGVHDTGAVYDLVAPTANAQKPAGEWNHMTISALGPRIAVELNGTLVTRVDLDRFDKPGERPDGSKHKFKDVTVKDLARSGHLGFQDHGSDCWYRDVRIKDLR